MEQVLNACATFPTATFTVFVCIILIYWLIGMLGLVDLDFSGDADVDVEMDVDSDTSISGATGFLLTFGLTGVPFSIVISIIAIFCWLISVYMQLYLFSFIPDGWLQYVVGFATNIIIFFISLPLTAAAIRPLKGLFRNVQAAKSADLVGKEAIIATATVTNTFGQARIKNEGAELLVNVRTDAANQLTLGDKVIVIEYQQDNHAYIVAPWPQTN